MRLLVFAISLIPNSEESLPKEALEMFKVAIRPKNTSSEETMQKNIKQIIIQEYVQFS